MNTRHSRRISRKAAEQLLDGAAERGQGTEAGPDQLVSVLAAAAAPGHDDELAGEQMAVAAFEANHLASVANFRREQMIKSPLAKILTVKVLASVLVVGASGGVALAASTGTFSSSGSGSGPAYGGSSVAAPVTPPAGGFIPSPSDSGSASASASPSGDTQQPAASSPASDSSSPASIPQTAAGLCNALAGDAAGTSGSLTKAAQQQALAGGSVSEALQSPEFSSLVSTAQSAANVPDYCGLLLDLPQLPQPAQLTQLPVSLLSQLLTQVPAATLAQQLTSLPSSTLSALLAELPVSTVSQILTSLPSSAVSQILTALPTSTLSQLLTELPNSAVSQILNELPTSVVSQLLGQLPNSVLSGLSGITGLSHSVTSLLPGL
jgi:MgtE intracellular N domain